MGDVSPHSAALGTGVAGLRGPGPAPERWRPPGTLKSETLRETKIGLQIILFYYFESPSSVRTLSLSPSLTLPSGSLFLFLAVSVSTLVS